MSQENPRVQVEQVYITHCLPADSVYNRPGFEVRATSTSDAALHQFALGYPAYELPLDLRRPGLQPSDAPCRLALLAAPGRKAALVHTVYVPEDTCGRKNSFFSHVLVAPSLTLRQALTTWGASEWKLDYPSGASKTLPHLAHLPRSGSLDDGALTSFLVAPEHRRLLRWMLQGVRLALRAGDEATRGRLYVLAEPATTAMLLYGVARLLPEARDAMLTFTTYESMHRVLREYRLARIVGTYTAQRDRGLEEDFFTHRGYAIDALNPRCSPELEREVPALFDEGIELASRGEWQALDAAFTFLGRGAVSAMALKPALEALRGEARVTAGEGTLNDLLVMLKLEAGRAALAKVSPELLWPLVRDHAAWNEVIRQTFTDLLKKPERLSELVARAAKALTTDHVRDWETHWGLLRTLLKDVMTQCRVAFLDMLRTAEGEPSKLRTAIVKEWASLGEATKEVPDLLHPFLTPRDEEERRLIVEDDALFAAAARIAGSEGMPLLQARCRTLLDSSRADRIEALMTSFAACYTPATTEQELKRVLGGWLKAAEGCSAEAHVAFLERFVSEEQRERVARALIKKGLLDEASWRGTQKVEEERAEPVAPRRGWVMALVTHLLAFTVGAALAWVLK